MRTRVILAIGAALIAMGTGTFTVRREYPEFTIFGFSLAEVGTVFIIIGLLTSALGIVRYLHPKTISTIEDLKNLLFKEWVFVKHRVNPDELPLLYNEFERFFGSDIASIKEMQRWMRKNPDIVWRITGKKGNSIEENVGFFELIPLNPGAVKKLDQGQLDARTMTAKHVSLQGNATNAFYIGSVAAMADTPDFKFATMFKFCEHVRSLTNGNSNSITLYARPVSKDGMRLVRAYQFKKVAAKLKDEESVWKVVVPANTEFAKFERVYRRALSSQKTLRA